MKQGFCYTLLALCCALWFGSCSLYTAYTRPDDITADGVFGEGVAVTDTVTLADLSWREFFTDPHLQALIERGLVNNIDMRTADLRIAEAEAALSTARLSYYPTVNFTPQGGLSTYNFDGLNTTYRLPVAAEWNIDVAGRLHNRKQRARAAFEQSEINRRYIQTRLIAAIANGYYTLLMLDSQLEVSRTTAANWKENVRIMKAMKDAGMTNEASVSQTEANSWAIETSLFDLRRQIRAAETSLSLLLGEAPHTIERGTLAEQTLREDLLVGVPAQLLANRPDVRSAELDLEQTFYNTNLARAAFYPSVSLAGTLGWVKDGVTLNPGQFLLSFVLSLAQPIFNGGVNKANLKIAQAQQEEARIAFVQTLLNAGGEVNDALEQCQTARGKSDLRRHQIAALESAVRSTQQLMRYSDKAYTYLEVLTAQQALLQAQLSQIADYFEGIQGMVNLYQALGGGRE